MMSPRRRYGRWWRRLNAHRIRTSPKEGRVICYTMGIARLRFSPPSLELQNEMNAQSISPRVVSQRHRDSSDGTDSVRAGSAEPPLPGLRYRLRNRLGTASRECRFLRHCWIMIPVGFPPSPTIITASPCRTYLPYGLHADWWCRWWLFFSVYHNLAIDARLLLTAPPATGHVYADIDEKALRPATGSSISWYFAWIYRERWCLPAGMNSSLRERWFQFAGRPRRRRYATPPSLSFFTPRIPSYGSHFSLTPSFDARPYFHFELSSHFYIFAILISILMIFHWYFHITSLFLHFDDDKYFHFINILITIITLSLAIIFFHAISRLLLRRLLHCHIWYW